MAPSRASVSSSRFRSPMSRAILEAPIRRPRASLTGDTATETFTSVPSLCRRTVWKCSTLSPARSRASTSRSSSIRSGGMIMKIDWPTASAAA